eukprot:504386-Prorocentrum_minimum.AAC.1
MARRSFDANNGESTHTAQSAAACVALHLCHASSSPQPLACYIRITPTADRLQAQTCYIRITPTADRLQVRTCYTIVASHACHGLRAQAW